MQSQGKISEAFLELDLSFVVSSATNILAHHHLSLLRSPSLPASNSTTWPSHAVELTSRFSVWNPRGGEMLFGFDDFSYVISYKQFAKWSSRRVQKQIETFLLIIFKDFWNDWSIITTQEGVSSEELQQREKRRTRGQRPAANQNVKNTKI